jgi:hypothetical protein
MSGRFKESVAVLRAVAVLGVVGAACLTRPVATSPPNLKTNFTSVIHSLAVDKLDLLFMIDNSSSMGDKQTLLSLAVPDMINRLVSPNCVDANGNTVGISTGGQCATGTIEFPPVHDMHIGIVSSSLGGRGSNQCDPSLPNQAVPSLPSHNNDNGELINRGGATETPVPKAQSNNFLAWYPPVTANTATPPANAETTAGDANTANTLIGDFTSMISGVHEHGCGFEAQNEAWYRFLIQPDPYATISATLPGPASYQGIDNVILTQRAAFLRPDSLVAIIVVTDETQETADPLSVGRLGYLFEQSPWPGSPTVSGAPEGTTACATNPLDPNCQSCSINTGASNYAAICPPDPPSTALGYLDPSDDGINVRFFHQKQRFGVDAGYRSSRYVLGLTSLKVPDSAHEVDGSGNYIGDQAAQENCVNPLFAQNLPTSSADPAALCNLTPGKRTSDLVYYAVIGGVPHQLLQAQAGVDPECPAGTNQADCPQKNQLTDSDWLKITGADPENYNFTGADPHMLESETPRQTGCDQNSADNCDPYNGREWTTNKQDLQYACIFQLPAPKDCSLTQMQYLGACDCAPASNSAQTPLCQKVNGAYTTTQINGKAYPTIAELVVAHAMKNQGIVSSLCPIHPAVDPNNPNDPVYGYRPAVTAIINRLKNSLSVQCLPQKLTTDPTTGDVPCLILVTLSTQGDETQCDTMGGAYAQPTADVLTRFRAAPHAAWVAAGGAKSGALDPSTFPTCVLRELSPQDTTLPASDFNGVGSCAGSADPGWCYLEGTAAGSCPQQIVFTQGQPPQGASVSLQCIEQANGAVDGG